MNWKLILQLSLFGLAMGIGTVFVISSRIEPIFWLVIFVVCGFLIARNAAGRLFLHGLLLGIVNSVWVTASHIAFFNQYIASHPQEAEMMHSMPMPDAPRLMMAMVGPVIGIVSGAMIGLLSLVAAKVIGRRPAAAAGVH